MSVLEIINPVILKKVSVLLLKAQLGGEESMVQGKTEIFGYVRLASYSLKKRSQVFQYET
ncbi:MAG: hypothetical protein ACYSWS_09455 [Planctomycetota bacterium]